MGGGQGQSKVGQESDRALAEIATQLYEATRGIRSETIDQITEGILTGDIQARRGEIQQAVEGAKQEGGLESQDLEGQLASAGQTRTPYGQRQLALQKLRASQKAGLVPADYIQAFIRAGEPILYGQAPETAITGLNSLSDIQAAKDTSAANSQNALLTSIISGGGQLGAAGITAASGGYNAQKGGPLYEPRS